MILITRVILLMVLIFLNVEMLSAHQGHHKNGKENIVASKISGITITSQLQEGNKYEMDCDFDDVMSLECCCCVNGICLNGNSRSCDTNNMKDESSCRMHCENGKSNDNNLLSQSVKNQNIYKVSFISTFLSDKKLKTNNLHTTRKLITQSTPTYISIQSFLI